MGKASRRKREARSDPDGLTADERIVLRALTDTFPEMLTPDKGRDIARRDLVAGPILKLSEKGSEQ